MSAVVFHYHVAADAGDIDARAETLLLEQTVELPRAAATNAWVRQNIIGEVLSIEPHDDGGFLVAIAQPLRTTALAPAQFLNVAFGNSSLQPDVKLVEIEPPAALFETFKGPRFGADALRQKLGAQNRALTATALKPMGLPPDGLAALAHDFAVAGIDIIKDDHGLADHDFCRFEQRVELCQRAVERANAETGGRSIYAPNLIGSPSSVVRQFAFAREAGAGAVLLAPMLVGPALLHELASDAALPIIAHPAFGGWDWIAPDVLFGAIFKWFGADASIYPHLGGRFSYSRETCASLARRLTSSAHGLKPALPVPAGGIRTNRVREILSFYGSDTMLLVGGSLLETGDVVQRAKDFVAEVASVSRELAS
ncbi:ribulose-bisphosphate carboxylase large chain [Rhodoblastus acidophilus]|uniref:RuBisCO large subunit C-terminal-like domain-containing protein n=1 Tax=Rhodoblastus acidophilus TaxID=1074 RepID=UPI0022249DA1|nr:RuBisCO large subunit C-terminal-like domain-containing protein [Rhodoblastus acidophilus]MCW2285934.1 ribulose-bisphosphate carboxylase large chain [Rhodoblastus acidophilus]MCW2334828.1 ribulose-bisphosphate carboxylase large chain [Rhodoblastus acidophilus]